MNTLKSYRIVVALTCLALPLALRMGNVHAGAARQGEVDFAAMDAYVETQRQAFRIPGMALGIVQGEQIVHLQGFGTADTSGRPVTPQTPFYIGSVTKSFTALAIMQLVEAGKIDLAAPVQTYLPWFELADKAASAGIAVRHLLNQTSGISEIDGNRVWSRSQGLEEYVRGLTALRLTQPVGTVFQYSNLNYSIAGLIVEKVSGQSYADYVTQHIFEPLEMRHSYASRAPALADGLAARHYFMYGRVFGLDGPMPPANLPAGQLTASVEDLSHYALAQLNDGRYGDSAILSPQGMAALHAPAIPAQGGNNYYAMGWAVGTLREMAALWHSGDDGRSHAIVMLMPDRGTGLVLLANASGYEQMQTVPVDQITLGLMSMLNGNPPATISQSFSFPRLFYWAIPLTPLLQILGMVLVWRNRRRGGTWRILLTVCLNLAVVALLLGIAQLVPFPFPSLLEFFPEVGYGLVIVAVLGIGWSVIYTAMKLLGSPRGLTGR